MKTPVQRFAWTGVFLIACLTSAGALDMCKLSDTAVCKNFAPDLKVGCTKHVQLAVAFCRRASRSERFGSHEDHCKAACKAGVGAYDLEIGLQNYAIVTAETFGSDNQDWLNGARRHWQALTRPNVMCTQQAFEKARADCQNHCTKTARRRDLEELQGLSKGGDFLKIQQPVFGCPPGPATKIFSGPHDAIIEHLYPPGHQRRTGAAAQ